MRIKKISDYEFNETGQTALGRDCEVEIIDHETPRSLLEAGEEEEVIIDERAEALRLFLGLVSEKVRSRTNPKRGVLEITRRVIALCIELGAIDLSWTEASEVLSTSRQNLHLIGKTTARRLGLALRTHPGKARAGFRGAISKHAKNQRPLI